MTQRNRVTGATGIDYDRLVAFKFNGKEISGYQGDTVASALLANNIRIILYYIRSFYCKLL